MAVPVSFMARDTHDPVITPQRCNNKLSIIILYHCTTTFAVYTYLGARVAPGCTKNYLIAVSCVRGNKFEGPRAVRQNNFLCVITLSGVASRWCARGIL